MPVLDGQRVEIGRVGFRDAGGEQDWWLLTPKLSVMWKISMFWVVTTYHSDPRTWVLIHPGPRLSTREMLHHRTSPESVTDA